MVLPLHPAYVVGSTRPEGRPPATAAPRRWPTTVHAVAPDQPDEQLRALCGTVIRFTYRDELWPPSLEEHWCPACVRATRQLLL